MRSFWLLASGLCSCFFLVQNTNRCFDGVNEPDALCFEKSAPLSMNGKIQEMRTGDIDGDGLLDVVAFVAEPGGNGALHVLFNNGDGTLTDEQIAGLDSVRSFEVADLQLANDRAEIAILHGGQLSLIRRGDGFFLPPIELSFPTEDDPLFQGDPRAVTLGRFDPNRDELQIAVAFLRDDSTARIQNFRLEGTTITPTGFATLPNGGGDLTNISAINDFRTQDIEPDDDAEFVVLTANLTPQDQVSIFTNGSIQPSALTGTIPLGVSGAPTAVVNLNETPLLEYIFGDVVNGVPAARVMSVVNGKPPLPPTQDGEALLIPLASEFQAATSGDINDDGRQDILVINASNQVEVIPQDEVGAFVSSGLVLELSALGVNEFRSAIAALDLNKDGIDDLLVADGKDRLEVILSVP